jgi:acyl transferase domain-containing protein
VTAHAIDPEQAVAIIGMAGRFPGARDIDQFWANLVAGVESITVFADTEAHDPTARSWQVNAGGVVEDIECFDADFFAIPPAEAAWMDPQHRLFLEYAWLALEDAGCDPSRLPRAVSVYAGANTNTYLLDRLDQLAGRDRAQFVQIFTGNEKDFLATQVSYRLNLRGESITVQTSCSTSLVAMHLACQSLLSGQSDRALAGGVSIRIPQLAGYTYEVGLIGAPDGRCRPFDHRARGTVPGSGVGVVVLARLADAIANRDHVYAVIRGSWINNDGRGKVGFTAPAMAGQAEVVSRALAVAGVPPETIRFLETHGTGTIIGDPIEFEALRRAFGPRPRRRTCALGAVKASIGHLDNAAGVAGLIKTALVLRHGVIPPAPHFERANPAIDFDSSPFYLNTEREVWPDGEGPRRAAVSSFGLGGTNAHAVLEDAPPRTRHAAARPAQIVTVSAKTPLALHDGTRNLARFVDGHPEIELRDIAFTRNVGRQPFAHRRYVVATGHEALASGLRRESAGAVATRAPAIAFMFTGQGALRAGMAHALYEGEPRFRAVMDACLGAIDPRLAQAVRTLVCVAARAGANQADASADAKLAQPEFALPALLALEYSLAQMWRAWGIVPSAVIGHSFGELVAACVAGVFPIEEALALAIARGRLLQRMPAGRMLAVPLPEAKARPWIDGDVTLAAINADERIVLSGPTEAIERVERDLRARGLAARWLNVPYAYHSTLLDPLLDDYRSLIARVRRGPLAMRCLSNLTADWLTDADVSDPQYWARQMRQPVRFADGLRRMHAAGHTAFVEIGPGQTLTTLARQVLGREATVSATLGPDRADALADWRTVLDTVGRLWTLGATVAWPEVERAQEGWCVPLPGYAFARQRHWIETRPRSSISEAAAETADTAKTANTTSAADGAASRRIARPVEARAERAEEQGRHTAEGRRGEAIASAAAIATDTATTAPTRAGIEAVLIEIWSEVLGRAVTADDNFLELGGDSLAAIRILSRLAQALPVQITIEQIITTATVAELARTFEPRETTPALAPVAIAGPVVTAASVTIAARAGHAPEARGRHVLSYAQEWLWTQQQLAPLSPAYHLPFAVRLRGSFDPTAFVESVRVVAERQDELRTIVVPEGRGPAAVVQDEVNVPLSIVDLSRCRDVDRENLARRYAQQQIAQLFDLSQAPPWRACIIQLAPDDHVLLFVLHHIIADGWSMGILMNEVGAAYVARRSGQPASVLPPLPMQYRELAMQQRGDLARDGATLVGFWKRHLAGVPPLLTLATRPRPATRSYQGARYGFRIAADLVARVTAVARREQATLYMALLATFQTLLFRLTGQEDFCVGTPIAGRGQRETERIIGCFMNTLPIRADLAGEPTFLDLLQRVRRATLDAFAHQALPFGRIVQELQPARSTSHTPLFQVVFDFNNTPPPAPPAWTDLAVEAFGAPMPTAKTDMIVDLWRAGAGEVLGAIEYDLALFAASDIERIAATFTRVLDGVAANPGSRVSTLSLESDADRILRAETEEQRDLARRERLAAIKSGTGKRSHVIPRH